MSVELSLTEVFRNVFSNDELRISRETTANDIDGWDSLSHVTLLMAVEDKFSIEFRQHEVVNLTNVGTLVDLIEHKLTEE